MVATVGMAAGGGTAAMNRLDILNLHGKCVAIFASAALHRETTPEVTRNGLPLITRI